LVGARIAVCMPQRYLTALPGVLPLAGESQLRGALPREACVAKPTGRFAQ
jgi:hypothetical protein